MQNYTDIAFGAALDGSGVVTGGVTYLAGATVTVRNSAGAVATIYSDDSATLKANPITTELDGEYSFYAANGIYSITTVKTGYATDTKAGVALFDPSDLASSAVGKGSKIIRFIQRITGAISTWLEDKVAEQPLSPINDFGVDNTGATNTTTALLAFYNACISTGKRGHIPAGTYKVTPGVLKFYTAVGKAWPDISTDGYRNTFFSVDTSTNVNAPVLEWTSVTSNGDHGVSWAGDIYWYGGSHGGITISDASGQTATLRNGINLTACWAIKFGYICGNSLPGSTVCVPANTINTTNPDPFAISYTSFEGIEGVYNKGFVFNGLNGVGIDSIRVGIVRGIQCLSGCWFGVGQGCEILQFSVGSCMGWAFDDGTQSGATSNNRTIVRVAEFDDVQYGIRLNKCDNATFEKIRFNHRRNFTALNTTGKYWPLTAIDMTAGSSPNVHTVRFVDIMNRIEAGGVLADLGVFLNTHASGNVLNLIIDADYADNGGLGVTDAWLTTGVGLIWSSTPATISRKGKVLWDSKDKAYSIAVGSVATTVPNSGFGTSASKISFAAQYAATYSAPFSLSTMSFTAPREGVYFISAALPLTTAVSTRVRLAVLSSTSGGTVELRTEYYSVNAAVQTYTLDGAIKLVQGATVYLIADQNTATAALAVTLNSNANECRFVVTEL